ncbi:MAG: hypothetical protein WA709_04980 [Stellaceae bacterium]
MAGREQSQTSKRGTDEKPQRDIAGGGHTTSGSKGEERAHGVKNQGSVGRDVPDESKERNTEIAVEAGHKGPGERRDAKR